MSFCIVAFLKTNTVEVVPAKWQTSRNAKLECYWPPYKDGRLKKAIMLEEEPEDTWELCDVKIIKSFETYEKARKKLNKAEDTDNLSSDCQKRITRFQGHRYASSSSSSSGSVENGPTINLETFSLPVPNDVSGLWHKSDDLLEWNKSVDINENDENRANENDGGLFHTIDIADVARSNQACHNHIILERATSGIVTGAMTADNTIDVTETATSGIVTSAMTADTTIDVTDIIQKLVQKIERIQVVQEQHTLMLNEIVTTLRINDKVNSIERPQDMPLLPISTEEDLIKMEQFLVNQTNYAYVCKLLSTVGGGIPQVVTRKVMTRIMTSTLALNFNWRGRPPKKAFAVLKTKEVIVDAVKKACGCTELEIENACKDWLKYAGLRVKQKS